MKISYIILPYDDPTYLQRCLKSIRRQTDHEYEIIVSEDEGQKYDSDYLKDSVASADGDFILFTDITTVVNVSLSDRVFERSPDKADIIFSGLRHRVGNRYVPVLSAGDLYNNIYMDICWFFFSKDFLKENPEMLTLPKKDIHPYIDIFLLKGNKLLFDDSISLFGDTKKEDKLYFDKNLYLSVFDLICEKKLAESDIRILSNYIDNLVYIIDAEDEEYDKNEAFHTLQYIGEKTEKNNIFRTLFSNKVGCGNDVLSSIDVSGYIYCKKNDLFDLMKKEPSDITTEIPKDEFCNLVNNHLLTQQITEEYSRFKNAVESLLGKNLNL